VVAAMAADFNRDHSSVLLPDQISMEVHYYDSHFPRPMTVSEVSTVMYNMAAMGFSVVSREDNIYCPHCTELTYVRTAC
jgi:hypothetical protein